MVPDSPSTCLRQGEKGEATRYQAYTFVGVVKVHFVQQLEVIEAESCNIIVGNCSNVYSKIEESLPICQKNDGLL